MSRRTAIVCQCYLAAEWRVTSVCTSDKKNNVQTGRVFTRLKNMAIAGDSQAKIYGWYIDKKINIKVIY